MERGQRGHPALWRLEPDHPVERRRHADRAADVRTGRECGRARGQRCTGAAARPTTRDLGVPRIARDAPQLRVGEAGTRELRRRRAHVAHTTGGEDPFDHRMRHRRDVVLEQQRAELPALAEDRLLLLQRHRQPLERPGRAVAPPLFGVARGGVRVLESARRDGVEGGFDRVGPGEYGVEQLDRAQRARGERIQRIARSQVAQFVHRGALPGRKHTTRQ